MQYNFYYVNKHLTENVNRSERDDYTRFHSLSLNCQARVCKTKLFFLLFCNIDIHYDWIIALLSTFLTPLRYSGKFISSPLFHSHTKLKKTCLHNKKNCTYSNNKLCVCNISLKIDEYDNSYFSCGFPSYNKTHKCTKKMTNHVPDKLTFSLIVDYTFYRVSVKVLSLKLHSLAL